MKTFLQHAALICLTLHVCSPASANLVINITGSQRGSIGRFGESTSGTPATFGQTFTVVAGATVLDEFAFYVTENTALDEGFEFTFHVGRWNGSRVDGPLVFSSGPMTSTNNGGAGGSEEIRFQIGQELDVGDVYVAFVTSEGLFDGDTGTVSVPIAGTAPIFDPYTGGEFVYAQRFDNFNSLSTTTWLFDSNDNTTNFDTHFEAVFSAVPEPSSAIGLLLLCVAGLNSRRVRER